MGYCVHQEIKLPMFIAECTVGRQSLLEDMGTGAMPAVNITLAGDLLRALLSSTMV